MYKGAEDVYEVQDLVDVRAAKGGRREFLVQWVGYGPEHNTWEPEANVSKDLISDFNKTPAKKVK